MNKPIKEAASYTYTYVVRRTENAMVVVNTVSPQTDHH